MKAGLLLCKQLDDKRSIVESQYTHIYRARLTACEVGVFSEEISQLLKIHLPPFLGGHLSPWVYFGGIWYYQLQDHRQMGA